MDKIPFCELCGNVLEIKASDEKVFGICRCGFAREIDSFSVLDSVQKKKEVGKGVLRIKESKAEFPHECKKCGYGGCDVFDFGAPWSDESNIYLYKCKKCGYVERQADGTGNK